MVWLDEIRQKFRAAAANALQSNGLISLFQKVDGDGSGEVDLEEFTAAVRGILAVPEASVSQQELVSVFAMVDVDGSGEIDSGEFIAWLTQKGGPHSPMATPRSSYDYEQPTTPADRLRLEGAVLKQKFHAASREAVESMGWQVIFDQYVHIRQ